MGIKSTQDITKKQAIERIIEIATLIIAKNYREIDERTFESEINLQEFVDNWISIDLSNIYNWTDNMLGNHMDTPFFRHSMFDNYLIKDET